MVFCSSSSRENFGKVFLLQPARVLLPLVTSLLGVVLDIFHFSKSSRRSTKPEQTSYRTEHTLLFWQRSSLQWWLHPPLKSRRRLVSAAANSPKERVLRNSSSLSKRVVHFFSAPRFTYFMLFLCATSNTLWLRLPKIPSSPPPSQRDVSLSRRGSGRRCDGSTVKPTQSTNSTTTTLATPLCAAFEEVHTERRKENIISLAVFPFVFLSFFDAAMALNPSRQMPSPVVGGGSLSTREFSPSSPPGTTGNSATTNRNCWGRLQIQ